MEYLSENIQWIFSGIGVLILGLIINFFRKSQKSKHNEQLNSNSIIINNNLSRESKKKKQNDRKYDENNKVLTRILFIDDCYTDFKMVSILKKSGWINTKAVKDITDLDDPKVIESDIIFVDINGVGTTLFDDQGLGLASALKKKYPKKKVVIYSSETRGDRFHRALREVDDCLPKNAEPYQFINLIESFSNQ